jgi:hypothetical protein
MTKNMTSVAFNLFQGHLSQLLPGRGGPERVRSGHCSPDSGVIIFSSSLTPRTNKLEGSTPACHLSNVGRYGRENVTSFGENLLTLSFSNPDLFIAKQQKLLAFVKLSSSQESMSKFKPKSGNYPRGLYHKTYYGRNLWFSVIS